MAASEPSEAPVPSNEPQVPVSMPFKSASGKIDEITAIQDSIGKHVWFLCMQHERMF